MALSFVNGLTPVLSVLYKSIPCVYGDVYSLHVSSDYIFISQPLSTVATFSFG